MLRTSLRDLAGMGGGVVVIEGTRDQKAKLSRPASAGRDRLVLSRTPSLPVSVPPPHPSSPCVYFMFEDSCKAVLSLSTGNRNVLKRLRQPKLASNLRAMSPVIEQTRQQSYYGFKFASSRQGCRAWRAEVAVLLDCSTSDWDIFICRSGTLLTSPLHFRGRKNEAEKWKGRGKEATASADQK